MTENTIKFDDIKKDANSAEKTDPNLSKPVTREEFIDVIHQIGENINQISEYLMQDVNTMYSKQVFPFQMRLDALEDILEERGIISKDDISKRAEENFLKLQAQAKEIKDKESSESKDSTDSE